MHKSIRIYGLWMFILLIALMLASRLTEYSVPWYLGYGITLFVGVISMVCHVWVQSKAENPSAFVRAYLAVSAIRLLMYIAVIAILLYVVSYGKHWVVIFFLINYISFTFLEVGLYFNSLRR